MRFFITLFFAFFLSFSAFAKPEVQTPNSEPKAEIVLISHVDFNKSLNMVVLDTELEEFTLKLVDQNGNEILRTQLRTGDSEILEIDLSDINGGTYQVKISANNIRQIESVIVPID